MAQNCRPTAVTPDAKCEEQCKLIRVAIVDGTSSRDDLKRQVCLCRRDDFRQVDLRTHANRPVGPAAVRATQYALAGTDYRCERQPLALANIRTRPGIFWSPSNTASTMFGRSPNFIVNALDFALSCGISAIIFLVKQAVWFLRSFAEPSGNRRVCANHLARRGNRWHRADFAEARTLDDDQNL